MINEYGDEYDDEDDDEDDDDILHIADYVMGICLDIKRKLDERLESGDVRISAPIFLLCLMTRDSRLDMAEVVRQFIWAYQDLTEYGIEGLR